jgi:predicted MFS family arabinose efflux permease
VKTRCDLGDDTTGLVLLLLGAGSIVAMPLAANLCGRFSCKPVALSGRVGLALILPLLSIVSSAIALGVGLVSFAVVGLGAANIGPILFRRAGTQHTMPKGLAVAALTTAGYAGMLAGPAAIGFLSKGFGLHNAFWFLAALFVCVPILGKHVTAGNSQ